MSTIPFLCIKVNLLQALFQGGQLDSGKSVPFITVLGHNQSQLSNDPQQLIYQCVI
jgi:hypothetical protein